MKTLFLLAFLIFFSSVTVLLAQHEADTWYFGTRAGIKFQNGVVTALNDGSLNSLEACAAISDKTTGQLLFYTDGETVWNRNHQVMNNGTGLLGGSSGTQSALIVPDPGNSDQYYIFTTPDLTLSPTPRTTKFHYSLVSLQNPNGTVIQKNVVLYDNVAEKLTATIDCAGNGMWIVVHHRQNNEFYSFHVTASGVNTTPVISSYSESAIDHTAGYIRISPDKSKIAIVSHNANSFLGLFDFNPTTGAITNYQKVGTPSGTDKLYGLSFSPDNTKLYVIGRTVIGSTTYQSAIFQFEANLGTATAIRNSAVIFPVRTPVSFVSAAQLGPDGRIYIASTYRPYLDVIDYPNLKGNSCGYRADAITLTGNSNLGLPNMINYSSSITTTDTTYLCTSPNPVSIGPSPIAGYTYSWDPPTGLSNPAISNPLVIGPVNTNEYKLKVTNPNGCETFLFYRVKKLLSIYTAPVNPVCIGASVQLSASGGDTYLWSPAADLDDPTKPNPIAKPKVNTRYKVIVTRGVCTDSAFVNVSVYPAFSSAGKDTTVCYGQTLQLGSFSDVGTKYFWEPATELSLPNVANPICTPTQTRQYVLTATNAEGCVSVDTVVVSVNKLEVAIVPVKPICYGTGIQLSASGGEKYLWSPSEGLDSPTKSNPIAAPLKSTKYKVLVFKASCTDSAYVTVDVIQPIATAGQDKTICLGASAQIGAAPVAGDTYSWEPTTGLNDPFIANPIASPDATTRYILASTRNGCTAYDTVMVSIGTIKATVQPATVSICNGAKTQLSASGGSEYRWEPATGLSDPTIPNPIASPNSTTNYKVIVSSGKCIDTGYVAVTVFAGAKANAGNDKTICPGSSAPIGMPPEAGVTYSWLPTTDLDDPTSSNPNASPKTNTDYILTVTGQSGCFSRDTVRISVGNIVAKVSNDTAICSGISVQLLASGGAQYEWSPAAGLSNTTIENPIASPSTTTTYKVRVSSGTCVDSAFVTIIVNPSPQAQAGADQTLCTGSSVQLGEAAQVGNTYAWQPAFGLDDATKANPTASPTSTTQYILTVTGQGGCVASDTVVVTVGKIKAIVSNDTSICNGASAQLRASGGTQYDWSPNLGLSNPAIASPVATPNITTQYRVIVSTGACIDTAFVTVTITPTPNADAGNDQRICLGASTQIGTPAEPGNTYAWSPTTGLTSPTSSRTMASPATTTTYTLQVTNPSGCVKSDDVTVTVNPWNERSFTLWPDTVTITPSVPFTSSLLIPSEVSDWGVRLKYDPLIVKFNSISGGVQAIPDNRTGELTIRGAGGGGAVTLQFDAFLPYSTDTVFAVRLTLDTARFALCDTATTTGNTLMLSDYCAKNIRSASGTGKSYYLAVKGNTVDFGVGLAGNVRLEVFDYIGNSVSVVSDGAFGAGEYSATLDLPVGVYYCRMRAGMYESVEKVLIAR